MSKKTLAVSSSSGLRFDCAGCAIVRGNTGVPGGVIYDGNIAILAADPEVPIPGFLVVTSKRHVRSLSELSNEECHEIIDIIFHAEKALKSLGITEITLVQEERSSHLHFWIFPNYDWMTKKYGKGITYLRDISEYAKETSTDKDKILSIVEKVRDYFNDCGIKTEA
ncbi:HIT family hydrolase [Candidatus Saccharibacteria bacterium]|nr:HIT family hydrolase [Candidatus Saccharibacteria bacterium]